MANTYLSETTLGTATDPTKFTFSAWVKTSFVGAGGSDDYQLLLGSKPDHSSGREGVWIWQNSEIAFYNYASAGASAITTRTSAKLRDVNGWYHIVVTGDASQSGTDKLKFYINGELQTEFAEDNRSNFVTIAHGIQDTSSEVNIGGYSGANYYFDGILSHVHFTDGYAYAASTFGSTDSTTGQWKINTAPSVTYGNNGFFILKDTNSGTDQSGNSNNFTVGGGTLTKSEDCPSNVFSNMNPLIVSNGVFSEGNNTVTTTSSNWCTIGSTLGATSGKYYWEVKANLLSGSSFYTMIGFVRLQGNSSDIGSNTTSHIGSNNGVGMYSDGGDIYYPGGSTSYGSSFSNGNIIGVALDLDNNFAYWSINGTWQNSGVPTSGGTGTGGYNISSFADGSFILPASSVQNYSSGNKSENEYNFGNGYFGTTAVSSAGTNASGNGIFEYDVPTGYTALSTKGLNL
tara:strand:+ start:60 stop:1433 length:1374 start_codon:yes stop_codon:yes gene_type:complete